MTLSDSDVRCGRSSRSTGKISAASRGSSGPMSANWITAAAVFTASHSSSLDFQYRPGSFIPRSAISAAAPGRAPDFGHPEDGGGAARGELPHGFEFLRGGGQGGLDRGDLTEPALLPGLLEPVAQAGVDLLQPWGLSRVDPEQGASDTGHFRARTGSRSPGRRSPGRPSAARN